MEMLVRLRELCGSCSGALEQPLVRSDPIHHVGNAAMLLLRHDPDSAVCLAHSMLHSQRFSDVSLAWRRYYEEAQLWGVTAAMTALTCATSSAHLSDGECAELCLHSIVRRLDLALLLSGAPGRYPLIQHLLDMLKSVVDQVATDAGLGCGAVATTVQTLDIADVGTNAAHLNAVDSRDCRQEKAPGILGRLTPAYDFPQSAARDPSLTRPVIHLACPTIVEFQKHWHTQNSPAVLLDVLTHWDALNRWNDPSYWMNLTLGGRRLVPVEVGSSYTDDDWGQKIVTFRDFLHTYMLEGIDRQKREPVQPKGYLAQHDLLRQVPRLHADIAIPDYCWVDDPIEHGVLQGSPPTHSREVYQHGEVSGARVEVSRVRADFANVQNGRPEDGDATSRPGSSPSGGSAGVPSATSSSAASSAADASPLPFLNIWLGPEGTVSPAHTDPHHNILAQVVGRKYVRLFAPSQNERLYPMKGGKGEVSDPDSTGTSAENSMQIGQDDCKKRKRRESDTESADAQTLESQKAKQCPISHEATTQPPRPDNEPTNDEASSGVNMSNTSSVDVGLSLDWQHGDLQTTSHQAEDLNRRRLAQDLRYPIFKDAEYLETVLHPGQCLFIPRGWWHYITSLDSSCSVSFWWD